jgi:hypothetical protein
MEADLKKYKIDLQMARNKENELRNQIVSSAASEFFLSLLLGDEIHSYEHL